MYKYVIFLVLIFGFGNVSEAQTGLFTNIANRHTTSLNGKWNYIIDPYEFGYYDYRLKAYDTNNSGSPAAYYNNSKAQNKMDLVEYNFDESPVIQVPGDWNSQEEKLLYYEGTLWYKRSFDYQKSGENNRVFLHFGAVNYIAEVYLNGQKLGYHEGGFTPFSFEITANLKSKDNYLVVKVNNNRFKEAVPTVNTDWWNYGGITRDVQLVEVPPVFVLDYFIQLKKGTRDKVKGFVQLSESRIEQLKLNIPELNFSQQLQTGPDGKASFEFQLDDLSLWSPESPKLYEVAITTGYETLKDQIGFRTVETNGNRILLNGSPLFLRGISLHEENTMRGGRAYAEADALIAFTWAKEMNCNFIRLAHYPHNEHTIRLADRMGILLWEEIPVYWTIDFSNEAVYQKAQKQLSDVITRDKNRACTIIWSMANETPQSEARNSFLKKLIEHTRRMDDTRLVSAALEHRVNSEGVNIFDDPISREVDILGFNQYTGWYGGHPDDIPNVKWFFDQGKPVLMSEFGAGALAGHHGDKYTRWTEEYQEYLYEQTILMMKGMPELCGVTPWILADFRSPRRNLPKIQDGWNRKGLISNSGDKKKAFFAMQKWYKEIMEQ
ncbi:MAG: beta-glucuronidase [Saprospiraceae bacterium]|nr:beta-glucuronidase [Saprospiraceae bacterium]MCB9322255.1 beta-glucuronidase [Lewinellaceae bacterium]